MWENAAMIGIIKNIYNPFIVISWWAINAYDAVIKDKIIIKSLFLMYLGLFLIFCTIIKIKKNKGMWINLNLKNILENSKGNKKYSTLKWKGRLTILS